MTNATSTVKDGFLCIRYTDGYSNEPKRVILYWPVCRYDADCHAHLIDKEAFDANNGSFSVRNGSSPYSGWTTLPLREGGTTKPIAVEHERIEPPKVRKGIEIRYRSGRWEKYLKSQGWVMA